VILRVLNFLVIGALILAAAYVYRIKFDATVQAEQVAKLRSQVRRERDDIAALRAQWGQLDSPERIETLAKRFLHLKPIAPTQFDALDRLPDRPAPSDVADGKDLIGGVIENFEQPTGSISVTEPQADASNQAPAPTVAPAPQPTPVPAAVPAPAPAASGAPQR
jgi:hypothetical protein